MPTDANAIGFIVGLFVALCGLAYILFGPKPEAAQSVRTMTTLDFLHRYWRQDAVKTKYLTWTFDRSIRAWRPCVAMLLLAITLPALAQSPPLAADIPREQREWYRNVTDSRGEGSCAQAAIGMIGLDQNVPAAYSLLWETKHGSAELGGAGPKRVSEYCKSRGIRAYVITGSATFEWMKWACRNGRGAAIAAGVAHFQVLLGHDPDLGLWYVCDVNTPWNVKVYSAAQFRHLHTVSPPWCVILDYPPAMPQLR